MPRNKSKKNAVTTATKKVARKPAMKAAAKTVPAKKSAPAKKRAGHGSVRTTILSLLADGAKTRKQLLELGGFSPASLFNVLKVLKTQGEISLSPDNRMVSVGHGASRHAASSGAHATPSTKVAGTALVPAGEHAARALHEALEAVQRLFVAPDRVKEKLITLDRLVSTMPAPIADVLSAIREDYVRMSSSKAPF